MDPNTQQQNTQQGATNDQFVGGTTTSRDRANAPSNAPTSQTKGLADAKLDDTTEDRQFRARALIDDSLASLRQARESYNALGMHDVVSQLDPIIAKCDRIGLPENTSRR